MALTYTRQVLSGSTNGRMVEVNATASPGTTIHTVGASATNGFDEVYIDAVYGVSGTGEALLTLEYGGTGTADQIPVNVPGGAGPWRLTFWSLQATTSIVRAFATATGLFSIGGWVNRAT